MSETKRETGGPAFPNITPDMNVDGGPGMSLRDYFAAKAMQAVCMHGEHHDRGVNGIANIAYEFADAMLAERSK